MRHGAGIRILGALLVLGAIVTLMAFAYGAGFSDGSVADTRNIPPLVFGGAFVGWHIVGLIVSLLVAVMVLRVMALVFFGHRHVHWDRASSGEFRPGGSAGHGPWHHGWHRSEWRSAGQTYFDEWHRNAHAGQGSAGDASADAAGGPTRGPQA